MKLEISTLQDELAVAVGVPFPHRTKRVEARTRNRKGKRKRSGPSARRSATAVATPRSSTMCGPEDGICVTWADWSDRMLESLYLRAWLIEPHGLGHAARADAAPPPAAHAATRPHGRARYARGLRATVCACVLVITY